MIREPWKIKIDLKDIFHDDDMPFDTKVGLIVGRLKGSGWLALKPDEEAHDDLMMTFEELAESEDEDDFNFIWDILYDIADRDQVWIGTI